MATISKHISSRADRFRNRRGFALLITITLLSFVVLLLVGLATYTRIETAISGNTQKQAQARQNALLALDVALGQLQKHAGPDQRVTATAEPFPNVNSQKRHYTGVWNNTDLAASPVWLVSGLENANPQIVSASIPADLQIAVAGANTDSSSALTNGTPGPNQVVVPLQDIKTVGVPGQSSIATIGRYAWWVGDQGVKAPVAVSDKSKSVTYDPWGDSLIQNDLGTRIRQQIGMGSGASDSTGGPVFELSDIANSSLSRVISLNQLAFARNNSGTIIGTLAPSPIRINYHAWTTNNFNVLANTASNSAGLRQDLSLDSSLLGSAGQAWLNYTGYMEAPSDAATSAFPPTPEITASSMRRRYVMQPGPPAISPVLSFFGLSFSFRNDSSNSSLEIASRCVVGLWNPYTGALVPEDLELVITDGLPEVTVTDDQGYQAKFDLQLFLGAGSGLKFTLPFTANGADADRSSWLPGRVYNWSASSSNGKTGLVGNPMEFYVRDSTPSSGGSGVIWSAGAPLNTSTSASKVSRRCFILKSTTLKIELRRVSNGVKIAEYNSAAFDPITAGTNAIETDNKSFDFAFLFRLPDGAEVTANNQDLWLEAVGRDPREPTFPASGYLVPGGNGNRAEQFGGPGIYQFSSSFFDKLLDRSPASTSYNEDAPVFELPRSPVLSLGMLQHLAVPGARPFSIGNSWGAKTLINSTPAGQLFDQYFFSGLVSGVNPTGSGATLVLPNSMLRVTPRNSTGAAITVSDLRSPIDSRSSKYLLQGGSFNLNSTSIAAWASVLRSVRFTTPSTAFKYLKADDNNAGTASIGGESPVYLQSTDAHFFRFSQSAQETYKAEAGQSAGGSTGVTPPKTELFRQGMVTLNSAQVQNLATKITTAIRAYQSSSGHPFRTLEEFLSPSASATTSLLEQAIADAGINVDSGGNPIEFSSQFLTQADIMTALAPVLFPRSDTFVIRAYGEALNPATSTTAVPVVEGRAWCEAMVQRIPDYFDPSEDATVAPADLTKVLNQNLGRRFKVVSFRWLTRSDI